MWRERLPDPRVGPSLPTYLHHATCISHWPLPPMRPTLSMYVLTRREREREYKWGRVTDREEMVGAEPSVRTQATSCGMTRVEGTASSVFSLTILAIRNLFRASTALFQQQRPARPPPPPRVTCMWRAGGALCSLSTISPHLCSGPFVNPAHSWGLARRDFLPTEESPHKSARELRLARDGPQRARGGVCGIACRCRRPHGAKPSRHPCAAASGGRRRHLVGVERRHVVTERRLS